MNILECRACGFTILQEEEEGAADPSWLCDVCRKKEGSNAPAQESEADLLPDPPPESPPPPTSEPDVEQNPVSLPESPPAVSSPGLFHCPLCGGKLRILEAAEGVTVRCPHCDQSLRVNAAGEVEAHDAIMEMLKDKAEENRRRIELRKTGRQPVVSEEATEEEGREEEDVESGPEPSRIFLFFLIGLPLFAGLLPAYVPAVLWTARRVVRELASFLG